MAIDSVSSSTGAGAPAVRSQTQTGQTQQAKEVRQAAEAKTQAQAKQQAEPARPVVNTQGQTTGTIINTTA